MLAITTYNNGPTMAKRNLSSEMAMERPSKRTKTSAPSKAAKASFRKIARQAVLRLAEKKIFSQDFTETPLDTFVPGGALSIIEHSLVTTGGLLNQRIGRQIRSSGLMLAGVINNNTQDIKYVRHLVLWLKDGSADITGANGEFFESAVTPTANLQNFAGGGYILGLLRKVNKAKFTVLHDSVIKLGASTDPTGAGSKYYKKYLSLKDALINYESNTQGGVNQDKRLIQVMFSTRSDNDEAATNIAEWSQHSQFSFTDT